MGQEKGQKHETFRTFGPTYAKSLEFLTLSGGQAGLSTPRDRKRAPANARKTSKTQCFSLFGPEKNQKLQTFCVSPPKYAKSIEFLTFFSTWRGPREGEGNKMRYGARKGSKTRDFSHISAQMCEKPHVFDIFLTPYLMLFPSALRAMFFPLPPPPPTFLKNHLFFAKSLVFFYVFLSFPDR